MLIGMQDDAMVLFGNPDFTFRTLKQLREVFEQLSNEETSCGVKTRLSISHRP